MNKYLKIRWLTLGKIDSKYYLKVRSLEIFGVFIFLYATGKDFDRTISGFFDVFSIRIFNL